MGLQQGIRWAAKDKQRESALHEGPPRGFFWPTPFLRLCLVPLCLQRSGRILLPYLRCFLSNKWVWKILDLPGIWDSHRRKQDHLVGASLHRIRYSTCSILWPIPARWLSFCKMLHYMFPCKAIVYRWNQSEYEPLFMCPEICEKNKGTQQIGKEYI